MGCNRSVTVVITTYNHAHFLAEAIDSVIGQNHPANEIIVVDDGSSDDPGTVVASRPEVQFIRQRNQGLASARNTGLWAASSEAIVFLDADDRLLPNALEQGLACLARAPRSGLAYGGYRRTDAEWRPIGEDRYDPVVDPYTDLLQGNLIGMHAAVMYSRDRLREIGGFDTSLQRCEDYDVYLRMAQTHPIASHPNTVAEYRIHGANISLNNPHDMLRWVLKVYERQKSFALARSDTAKAWHHGRSLWRDHYSQDSLYSAKQAWMQSSHKLRAVSGLLNAMLMSPRHAARMAMRAVQRRLIDIVPSGVGYVTGHGRSAPALGRVRFGDLDRSHPIDNDYGFGRGTPIDRGYIEDFLSHHAKDIRGRVLEVGDDAYSRRFGGGRITHQDILHIDPSVTWATIVGDLAKPGVLPTAAFDCMIITQTLHLIYDMVSAVREIHRALRPDGVVLVTVPGISPIDRGEWRDSWYWSLTEVSARRLFNNVFGADHVEVETQGNVFAATAFLYGLALEEVPRGKLSTKDLAFPVIVSVRAQKASES